MSTQNEYKVYYGLKGNKKIVWSKNGKYHKEDGPAVIHYGIEGNIDLEKWYKDNNLHRTDDKPAEICYYQKGNIRYERWYEDNKIHRVDDKPAVINYDLDGDISIVKWYKDNKIHREDDKPAVIEYFSNGNVSCKKWYKDDKLHRSNGEPAVIYYDPGNNKKYKVSYFVFDKEILENKYFEILYLLKKPFIKYRLKKRKELFQTLKQTQLNIINGPDISKLVSTFVY